MLSSSLGSTRKHSGRQHAHMGTACSKGGRTISKSEDEGRPTGSPCMPSQNHPGHRGGHRRERGYRAASFWQIFHRMVCWVGHGRMAVRGSPRVSMVAHMAHLLFACSIAVEPSYARMIGCLGPSLPDVLNGGLNEMHMQLRLGSEERGITWACLGLLMENLWPNNGTGLSPGQCLCLIVLIPVLPSLPLLQLPESRDSYARDRPQECRP